MLSADTVDNDVGSPADDQLPNSRPGTSAAKGGMMSESFHDRHDARCQPFRGLGVLQGVVGADFLKAGSGEWRPDDLYRHRASSSCSLPQTHFGGGNSRSVPQERSQAFMSSCRM